MSFRIEMDGELKNSRLVTSSRHSTNNHHPVRCNPVAISRHPVRTPNLVVAAVRSDRVESTDDKRPPRIQGS